MNLRDLKYLVSVAKFGNFGRAAEACFVSQPALSMQIKKLEKFLGVQIFERNNKSVLITDAGANIVNCAEQILQKTEELKEIANSAKDPLAGEFKLGLFPTLGPYLLPHIIAKLSQTLPNIDFYLVEEKTEVLLEMINKGEIHAALLSLDIIDKSLASHTLFEEEFMLAVSHNSPLSNKKIVTKNDIDHQKLLLLSDGHCLKDQLVNFCQHIENPSNLSYRATSLEILRHMVAANSGMTLMPKLATEKCSLATYIPFKAPKPKRTISLVYKKITSKKVLLKILAKQIQKIMASLEPCY